MIEPIEFAWVCRNKHFNEVERVELTDQMLLQRTFPSWIVSDNCEVIAKIRPTGFNDINGPDPSRKLWEGDVMEFVDNHVCYHGIVEWKQEAGQWILRGQGRHDRFMLWYMLENRDAHWIGSVFENQT